MIKRFFKTHALRDIAAPPIDMIGSWMNYVDTMIDPNKQKEYTYHHWWSISQANLDSPDGYISLSLNNLWQKGTNSLTHLN